MMPRSASTHSRRVPARMVTRASSTRPSARRPQAIARTRVIVSCQVSDRQPPSGVGWRKASRSGVLWTRSRNRWATDSIAWLMAGQFSLSPIYIGTLGGFHTSRDGLAPAEPVTRPRAWLEHGRGSRTAVDDLDGLARVGLELIADRAVERDRRRPVAVAVPVGRVERHLLAAEPDVELARIGRLGRQAELTGDQAADDRLEGGRELAGAVRLVVLGRPRPLRVAGDGPGVEQ